MKLTTLLVCAASAWAQGQPDADVSRVFNFAHTDTQNFQDVVTALRTVAEVQEISVDNAARSLTVSASADKMALAEWLFHELDQPAGAVQGAATHEYAQQIETPSGPEVVKVFYLANAKTRQALNDDLTGVRTVTDVPRLFVYSPLEAMAARGPANKMTAAEWLIHEVDRPAGEVQAPAVHTYGVAMPGPRTGETSNVMKVIFLAHAETQQAINDMITSMRTVADVTRLFAHSATKALMVCAAPENVAIGEWLFHELDQPPAENLTAATYEVPVHVQGRPDEVVRVFHLAHATTQQQLTDLATTIRSTTGIPRIYTSSGPRAISLRGTLLATEQAGALVKQKDQSGAQ
jgi:type II secretory pathway component GspD/PulD (secretin)